MILVKGPSKKKKRKEKKNEKSELGHLKMKWIGSLCLEKQK